MTYARGAVVKGPDLFAGYDHRPYVCLSDERHPFADEEALYAVVTSTPRTQAVSLTADDFESGSLPRESYVNPWTITSIRHADVTSEMARLGEEATDDVARAAAFYLGIRYVGR